MAKFSQFHHKGSLTYGFENAATLDLSHPFRNAIGEEGQIKIK